MSTNGRNPAVTVALPPRNRFRSTWPLLLVAALFVLGAFFTWYFTWFGRELNDQEISTYLVDEQHPRKVQHALSQIQQRMEKGDPRVKQWYPQLVKLTESRETEVRLTLAWLMGSDNSSNEFHISLLKLVGDSEPIVRRNAALALIRFGDAAGRNELRSVFVPYEIKASVDGVISSTLKVGANVSRGALLARIEQSEVRSPLPGTVQRLMVQTGSHVKTGDQLLMLLPDEQSIWETLRGLALIGQQEEIETISRYVQETPGLSPRLKEQATLTVETIQGRLTSKS